MVRPARFPACASGKIFGTVHTKMLRHGDALRRCVPRRGRGRRRDLGGDRGELAVGDGSEETGRGVRGAPEGAYPGAPSRQERPIDWSGCDTAVPMSSPGKRRA